MYLMRKKIVSSAVIIEANQLTSIILETIPPISISNKRKINKKLQKKLATILIAKKTISIQYAQKNNFKIFGFKSKLAWTTALVLYSLRDVIIFFLVVWISAFGTKFFFPTNKPTTSSNHIELIENPRIGVAVMRRRLRKTDFPDVN